MEMLQGLPVRNLRVRNKEGKTEEFLISTEIVNELITPILGGEEFSNDDGLIATVKGFDDKIKYYLPYAAFMMSEDKEVLEFIDKVIDPDHYDLSKPIG